MKSWLFLVVIFSVLAVRSMGQNTPIDTSHINCIAKANLLIDEALLIIQNNYYKKDSVQWGPLLIKAKNSLNQQSNCDAAYKTVQWCFDQINEKHSYIMPPKKAALYNGNINSSPSSRPEKIVFGPIRHEIVEGDIAYLNVPWIATTDVSVCTQFADSIQYLIKSFDKKGVNKWIIDLRNNTGGNCWPMLAGLGPLLGDGIHGFFVSAKETIPISYKNGIAMQGKQPRCEVSQPYSIISDKQTIVILTSNTTSSAGEIVALAFKGRNNVYLYGEPTAGLTTANAAYSLSDGSMLVLTVCREADRNGKIIEGKIQPDELIIPRPGKSNDSVKDAAVMFLQTQ